MFVRRGTSLILTVALGALAQSPSTPQQQTANQRPMLRTGARLVVVDVVVTDKNGNAIHNLKAEDFALYESNVAQTFKSFEEHVAPSAIEAMRLPAMPKLPPGIFTNYAVGPENGPLNILLLDRLNTAQTDQMVVQQEVKDYLKSARPGARMAIFGLTDHLILLQGFTSNPDTLRAVVNQSKSKGSPLLTDAAGSGSSAPTMSDVSAAMDDQNGGGVSETTEMMQQFETMQQSFQDQLRGKYTLDALNLLARYLGSFPGRKNLIWFSGSFPVNIMPDQDAAGGGGGANSDPFMGVASLEKEFRQTTALLSRSQVAVYPIGAKGLEVSAMTQASTDSTTTARYLRNPRGVQNAVRKEGDNRFSEHSTMYMMADDTGGKATVDNNGLAKAIETDLQNGANYYTIAYSPTDAKLDGGFRSIQVKLKEQGYNLSYRRGYFAEDTEAPEAAGSRAPSLNGPRAPLSSNALALALVHGAPAPMQVIFSSRVQPLGTKTEEYPAPNNRPAKGAKGPFQRYAVDFAIDPRELHFMMTADGNRHETVEFVTCVYNAEGEMMFSTSNSIAANIIPAAYAQFQQTGVPFHQEISVPVKGDPYYLRLAVRDVEQDKVGAVEVPVATVRNLPAGPQPKPAPAPAPQQPSDEPRMGGHGGHHSN